MTRYADLHIHTFYSDGTLSPEEVARQARDSGLAAIAICDHDCTDGIDPCQRSAFKLGLEVIPGIELTVEKDGVEVHMLGYFIDRNLEWFQKKLKDIRGNRVNRIYKMVSKLKDVGVNVDPEEVFRLASKGSVGRLHLAYAMFYGGQVRRVQEAFDNYIGSSKPCYVPHVCFSSEEAIGTILKLKGVPVLAHPYVIGKDEFIPEFVKYGLRGIEVYHTDHSSSTVKHYNAIASRYNLIATGGSDCHGLGKGRILMGGVKVPYVFVERLKEEAKAISKS